MASPKQVAANRENANRSTGPKSPAGKSRSRRNSLKHGLLSRELVVLWEDDREYHKLLNALVADHCPEGATEVLLVEQLAVATWKLSRLTGIESAVMNRQFESFLVSGLNPGNTTDKKIQYAMSHTLPKNLHVLINYETQLTKGFHRALSTLHTLQKKRRDAIDGEAVTIMTSE